MHYLTRHPKHPGVFCLLHLSSYETLSFFARFTDSFLRGVQKKFRNLRHKERVMRGLIYRLGTATLMVAILATPTFAWETPQSGNSIFFTLNPRAKTSGPIQTNDSGDDYVNSIFRVLVQQGHQSAQEYWEAGDERAYFSFLLGALSVPYHESNLQHFRKLNYLGSNCVSELNNGADLKQAGAYLYRIFRKYFKGSTSPVVPNCEAFSSNQGAVQLLSSYDRYSVGLMQVALNWHMDGYVTTGAYLSVASTAQFGLGLFKTGFDRIYRASFEYPCLTKNPIRRGDPVNYVSLVRGAWAGAFNSGDVGQTCRFDDRSSTWRQSNDDPFYREIQSLLYGGSLYHQKLTGTSFLAFREIIDGVMGRAADHRYLSQILGSRYSPTWVPSTTRIRKIVRSEVLNVRSGPSTSDLIIGELQMGARLTPIGEFQDWTAINFNGKMAYVFSPYLENDPS